ncbi:unnamed protein product [Prorocentrum cordatum]|uniref:Uncharacterized protein n=1 Tax=Prorocentrum cordatum TaxID=2364126 RepID=A0ABN9W7D1_9DINO|nr:unnamed protein product [Polarella glacialis]
MTFAFVNYTFRHCSAFLAHATVSNAQPYGGVQRGAEHPQAFTYEDYLYRIGSATCAQAAASKLSHTTECYEVLGIPTGLAYAYVDNLFHYCSASRAQTVASRFSCTAEYYEAPGIFTVPRVFCEDSPFRYYSAPLAQAAASKLSHAAQRYEGHLHGVGIRLRGQQTFPLLQLMSYGTCCITAVLACADHLGRMLLHVLSPIRLSRRGSPPIRLLSAGSPFLFPFAPFSL